MRTAFIEELISEARRRPEIFLAVGDLGYSVVEPFAKEFPDRFLNAGVAEQNMTGIAAGLASEGYHVFTYSIANFPVIRCLEQIRNDVCYHNLPVTIVAVGAGLAYGNLGYSHHGVQDIAALAGLPNLKLLSPADPGETRACLRHLLENAGPSFLRLGKAGEPHLHSKPFTGNCPIPVVNHGRSHALAATGSILGEALAAAAILEDDSVFLDVYSIPWLAPITNSSFPDLCRYERIYSLEEHVEAGGLGDILRRTFSGPRTIPVHSFAVAKDTCGEVGDQTYLRSRSGLDAETVAAEIARLIETG